MRKKRILMVAYLAAAFLVTAGFAVQSNNHVAVYRRHEQYSYERALADLAASVGDMEVSLTKSLCATSPELFTACCADVYARSLTAQAALGQLPSGGEGLESTASFISRAGAYSLSLAQAAAGGNTPGAGDYENLASLKDAAQTLTADLHELYYAFSTGDISAKQFEEDDADNVGLPGGLQDIEDAFPALPTLIYDGPFSEEEHEGEAKMLIGQNPVSEDDARLAAEAFTGWKGLEYTGKREAKLPVYVFEAEVEGVTHIAEVTVQGGSVLSFRSTEASYAENLSQEKASEAAKAFLAEHGFENMAESYHEIQAGHSVICFVCEEDGVLMYPDLIKVAVNLENGAISGFDAEGYLMNHSSRSLSQRIVTEETALTSVSPWLHAESCTPCVIPSGSDEEAYCLEVLCTGEDGRHYLVYVNALSGEEEKILILLEDDSGTLTR